ncbi:MAG TPA: ComF family protein [Pseudonocardiaceae bacterium]|nr:ComF family protein [Pseudonocardiaceae bacterium]
MTTPPYAGQPPPVAGFGNCGQCPYVATGPARLCQWCAAQTLEPAVPYYCTVYGQALESATSRCGNVLCYATGRAFAFNQAIAMKTGALDNAITRHKYHGEVGWAIIFARVLLGYLDTHSDVSGANLIIPMPAVNPSDDHAVRVIQSAIDQDERGYPFRIDPPVIVKTAETTKMVATTSAAERREAARELYDVLVVPGPTIVRGNFIVVFDDVFTGGNTLNAVAGRLREVDAATVAGLALARAPWR